MGQPSRPVFRRNEVKCELLKYFSRSLRNGWNIEKPCKNLSAVDLSIAERIFEELSGCGFFRADRSDDYENVGCFERFLSYDFVRRLSVQNVRIKGPPTQRKRCCQAAALSVAGT
jgi:hypothetical protein